MLHDVKTLIEKSFKQNNLGGSSHMQLDPMTCSISDYVSSILKKMNDYNGAGKEVALGFIVKTGLGFL